MTTNVSPSSPMPNLGAASQDPLAGLKPLQLPSTIDSWPWAPGWFILIFGICFIIGLTTFLVVRHRRNTLYKRQALSKLQTIESDFLENNNLTKSTAALSALLKQFILVHMSRKNVSQLSGQAWLELLDSASQSQDFTKGCGSLLGNRAFKNLEQDSNARKDLSVLFGVSRKLIKTINIKHLKEFQDA